MTEQIKPCPFCGSDDAEFIQIDWDFGTVKCNQCKALGPAVSTHSYGYNREQAEDDSIAKWNTLPQVAYLEGIADTQRKEMVLLSNKHDAEVVRLKAQSAAVPKYACVRLPCLMLEKAKAELDAAITQMVDKDDRIICDHVRDAAKLIEAVISSMDAVAE